MSTTPPAPNAAHRAVAMFSVLVLAVLVVGCGPPQIGPDRATFQAIDALFTAVSLRDPVQLDRCAATLRDLRASDQLPDAAADQVEAIIAEARGGQWEPAQERLHDFMAGQHR